MTAPRRFDDTLGDHAAPAPRTVGFDFDVVHARRALAVRKTG